MRNNIYDNLKKIDENIDIILQNIYGEDQKIIKDRSFNVSFKAIKIKVDEINTLINWSSDERGKNIIKNL
jgi:hypothetical protein|nr:MAG TPA: hypothetical protein [Caudoviricetes sp.]